MVKFDNQRREDLVERLNRHPELREKIEALLDIADNKSGNANKGNNIVDTLDGRAYAETDVTGRT